MKKIVFLAGACLILSIFILIIYRIAIYVRNYKSPETVYDENLNSYQYDIINRIVSKLHYLKKYKDFNYKKNEYSIIVSMIPIDEKIIDNWRKWAIKGKRAIVFYNRRYNAKKKEYENYSGEDIKSYSVKNVKINDMKFKNIKKIFLNSDKTLYKGDPIFSKPLENLIIADNSIVMAKEICAAGGEIIYIADQRIFSDYAILKADNALLLNDLLMDYYNKTIVFDNYIEYDNNYVSDIKNPFFLFMGNFNFIFWQIIIIIIAFFIANIKRFGPWLDKDKFERRSLVKHIEAVGFFYEKSKNPFVYVNILDRYFFMRLKNIIRIRYNKRNDIINEVKKRYGLSREEEEIFLTNDYKNIVKKEIMREKFIRKLKGL
jgi:hypothetical protein